MIALYSKITIKVKSEVEVITSLVTMVARSSSIWLIMFMYAIHMQVNILFKMQKIMYIFLHG